MTDTAFVVALIEFSLGMGSFISFVVLMAAVMTARRADEAGARS